MSRIEQSVATLDLLERAIQTIRAKRQEQIQDWERTQEEQKKPVDRDEFDERIREIERSHLEFMLNHFGAAGIEKKTEEKEDSEIKEEPPKKLESDNTSLKPLEPTQPALEGSVIRELLETILQPVIRELSEMRAKQKQAPVQPVQSIPLPPPTPKPIAIPSIPQSLPLLVSSLPSILDEYIRLRSTLRPFNIQHYYYLNTDLSSSSTHTLTTLWNHWLFYGRFESRMCNLYTAFPHFNPGQYKRMNPHYFVSLGSKAPDPELHFLQYGIKGGFRFSDRLEENERSQFPYNITEGVKSFFRTNSYTTTNVAFCITTCIRTAFQAECLEQSIQSIRKYYPIHHIYVINDGSTLSVQAVCQKFTGVSVHTGIVSGGGEINPYCFMQHSEACRHDKLVYMHDSCFLRQSIDAYLNTDSEILFYWYSTQCLKNDVFTPVNRDITRSLEFYLGSTKINFENFYRQLLHNAMGLSVKFGCMSIFTRRFCEKVNAISNLFDIKHSFRTRANRCLLERILTGLYFAIYGGDYPLGRFLCGNIHSHPDSFTNTNIHLNTRMPFVKVWQGR